MLKSTLVSSIGSIVTAFQSYSYYKREDNINDATLNFLMTTILLQAFFSYVLFMVGIIDISKYSM